MLRTLLAGSSPLLRNEVIPVLSSGQVRYWKYNRKALPYKFIKPAVPVDKLSMDEPVTTSILLDEGTKSRKFEWTAESLNAKGFLRQQKGYTPPGDAKEQVLSVSKKVVPSLGKMGEKEVLEFELKDARLKFDLLGEVFRRLNHSVPNSMLYMIRSVGDVVNFYTTEIKITTPFDELVRNQNNEMLPPNLHVQKEPIRFHPETDVVFGGVTAFPKSSTIVTGLRAKKKYKGYEAKKSWP